VLWSIRFLFEEGCNEVRLALVNGNFNGCRAELEDAAGYSLKYFFLMRSGRFSTGGGVDFLEFGFVGWM
jgi:hypothetical protein